MAWQRICMFKYNMDLERGGNDGIIGIVDDFYVSMVHTIVEGVVPEGNVGEE